MSNFSFLGAINKKTMGAMLVDVGSGSIGVALTIFKDGEKPALVFETREQLPIGARLSHKRLLPVMISFFEKLVGRVAQKGLPIFSKNEAGVKVEKIIVQLSSPWHISTTKSLHFKFEKSFLLTPIFIKDILSYENKNFLTSVVKDDFSSILGDSRKSMIVEQEVLETKINGYPVKYPIDRMADDFEATVFMSAFPNKVIESAKKFFGRYFPELEPEFHSTTVVYFDVFRHLFPDEGSFIVVHVSGETTDVSVIKNNIITETISFPLGRNFIIRKLMNEVKGINSSIALSMIRVHSDGDTLPKFSAKLREILSQAESDWIELFADSMRDFSKNFFLPTKAFIIAGDNSAPVFADMISKSQLSVRGPGTPTIVAEAIGLPLFDGMVENRQSEGRDPFLSAQAVFAEGRYFGN